MPDNPQERIANLEAKVQELDTLVNLVLRLLACEKPLSALLARSGASEAQDRAVHALLDDVISRVEAGGIYTPAFPAFLRDLEERFPAARGDREFVSLLLDTLKVERPAYRRLHVFVSAQGWPHWR